MRNYKVRLIAEQNVVFGKIKDLFPNRRPIQWSIGKKFRISRQNGGQ